MRLICDVEGKELDDKACSSINFFYIFKWT